MNTTINTTYSNTNYPPKTFQKVIQSNGLLTREQEMNNGLTEQLRNNLIIPVLRDKRLDLIDQYFSPTADIQTTFLVGKGPEVVKKSIQDLFNAFPTFELFLEESVHQECKITYKWSALAEHKGTFLNIRPTGKQLFFHGIVFGEVHDGLITKYHCFSNILQVLFANCESSISNNLSANNETATSTIPTKSLESENNEKWISEIYFLIVKRTGVKLTPREIECLNFWIKGYSIKETARQLGGLSVKTIQVFRDKIRKKFNVSSYRRLFDLMKNTGVLSSIVSI